MILRPWSQFIYEIFWIRMRPWSQYVCRAQIYLPRHAAQHCDHGRSLFMKYFGRNSVEKGIFKRMRPWSHIICQAENELRKLQLNTATMVAFYLYYT